MISTKVEASDDGERLTAFSDQGIALRLVGDPGAKGRLARVRLTALAGRGMWAELGQLL